ncbi:MAG: PilN domain-containing protein [Bdellovibrionales bacterium]|nr:PilN domain-containing protein [Bdellovibrionales bacterium]
MIRINLLQNRSNDFVAGEAIVSKPNSESSGDQKQTAVKLILIILFPVGLFVFENMNISELTSTLKKTNSRVTALEADLSAKKVEANKVSHYQKEMSTAEQKLNIIRGYTKNRLTEIRSLDVLQNLVPEELWLTYVSYVKEEFIIKGETHNELNLNQFMQKLEKSGVFTNVLLLRSTKEQSATEGTVRRFVISSRLGITN